MTCCANPYTLQHRRQQTSDHRPPAIVKMTIEGRGFAPRGNDSQTMADGPPANCGTSCCDNSFAGGGYRYHPDILNSRDSISLNCNMFVADLSNLSSEASLSKTVLASKVRVSMAYGATT